jgi:hypothetical protein
VRFVFSFVFVCFYVHFIWIRYEYAVGCDEVMDSLYFSSWDGKMDARLEGALLQLVAECEDNLQSKKKRNVFSFLLKLVCGVCCIVVYFLLRLFFAEI